MKLAFKLFFALCIILSMSNKITAQEVSAIEIKDNISRVNFTIQGVYYSFEKKLAPVISLYSDIGSGFAYGSSGSGNQFSVSPTIATEGRWYFTYKRRYRKGKKTLFNSAEFLSLQAAYSFKSFSKHGAIDDSAAFFLVAYAGLQRIWGKHINFEFKFGYGLGYKPENSLFGHGGNLNLKFGYVFNKS